MPGPSKPQPLGADAQPDLYTRWLGLPPTPRPVDHYLLLGVEPGTSDPAMLKEHAERQLEKLEKYALSSDRSLREACQDLMDEVALALTTLANPARRAAYDARFAAPAPAPVAPPPPPPELERAKPLPPATVIDLSRIADRSRAKAKQPAPPRPTDRARPVAERIGEPPVTRSSWLTPRFMVLSAAAVALLALAMVLPNRSGPATQTPSPPESESDAHQTSAPPSPDPNAQPPATVTVSVSGPMAMIDLGPGATMILARMNHGQFQMGSPTNENGRSKGENLRQMSIESPFYLGVTEVTQAQWQAVMGNAPWEAISSFKQGQDYPASGLSWQDAQEFCTRLSARVGRTVRLPTEAEWEYACRAGSATQFGSCDDADSLRQYAWFVESFEAKQADDSSSNHPQPVARKNPNAWGMYDMHGNVSEWCEDYFEWDPTKRISRGGAFTDTALACRSASRRLIRSDVRYPTTGLRVILVASAQQAEKPPREVPSLPPPTAVVPAPPTPPAAVPPQPTPPSTVVPAPVNPPATGPVPTKVVQAPRIIEEGDKITVKLGEVALDFVRIEAGEFQMGSPLDEKNRLFGEKPHRLKISEAFFLGKTEVTQAQWKAVMQTEPWIDDRNLPRGDDFPVITASWHDAVEFCVALSRISGRRFRLPTEAEWEYACRAGSEHAYSHGDDEQRLRDYAWFAANPVNPPVRYHPVARKKPNAWGLYDMHGNVGEWTSSSYEPYPYRSNDGREEAGSDVDLTDARVFRGGAASSNASDCRSACRKGAAAITRGSFGFRVLLDFNLRGAAAVAPADAVPAKKTAQLGGVVLDLVRIEAGKFTMGSPHRETGRRSGEDQKEVTIAKAFYLGATEVTRRQWRAVMDTTPWKATAGDDAIVDSTPATDISWSDAQEFCQALSRRVRGKYRLPTEAEWEYACRAGSVTAYSFANDAKKLGDYALFGGIRLPNAVATKAPNSWNLYDMHGSVSEWCGDTLPGGIRVSRGGSYKSSASTCRSAAYQTSDGKASGETGFRVLLEE